MKLAGVGYHAWDIPKDVVQPQNSQQVLSPPYCRSAVVAGGS